MMKRLKVKLLDNLTQAQILLLPEYAALVFLHLVVAVGVVGLTAGVVWHKPLAVWVSAAQLGLWAPLLVHAIRWVRAAEKLQRRGERK